MNHTDLKVSVIIPVYNAEEYLIPCIDSVLNQTLKEIEIICVNDGSTDQSLEILKQYEVEDSRVKVYSKSNSGYGHTINYGLERSRGKYIVIVESDDFIEAEGVEQLYCCAEMNGAQYVRSNYYEFGEGKDRLNGSLHGYPYNKVLSAVKMPSLFFSIEVSPWACIYKKDFLDKNQIKMNETPGAAFQDNSWQFLVLLNAERIVFLEEALYHYRIDNAGSSVNSREKVFCVVDEKKYMEEKIEECRISDIHILAAYSRFIYKIYKWNYGRVAEEFQYAFLLEWKKELESHLNRGILRKEIFEENQWNEINSIIHNVDRYFEKTAKAYALKDMR